MAPENRDDQRLEATYQFFADVFDARPQNFRMAARLPDSSPHQPGGGRRPMTGAISLKNQPEFWADAPWRIEPDRDQIPVSFHVRDADIEHPAKGPWRLDLLKVEQCLEDGSSYKLLSLLPSDLEAVDDQGMSTSSFWVSGAQIPLADLQQAVRGDTVHLRVVFAGSFPPHNEPADVERHLETYLAQKPLPAGRAAHQAGPRHWFYGDTHYHSAYTNDVKEYGGAVPEARRAGQAVGLDWLVITDHSCDLDEVDPGFGGKTRWERLVAELADPKISDTEFRVIKGEEITLYSQEGGIVHMLAMGAMETMVEGAFLPSDGGGFQADLARKALEKILEASHGYSPDIPKQLFSKILKLETVLDMLPEDTLTFAAHPYDVAQIPPAKWSEDDLALPQLTGHEFWNGRTRSSTGSTCNPFTRAAWTNPETKAKKDRARIRKLQQHAKGDWEPHLQAGVKGWLSHQDLPSRRPVFIAGSDAHGDFNYHSGWAWDYRKVHVNDNALGKVRTAVYLPEHDAATVPETGDILAALRKGACVVTDGPLLEFSITFNGQSATVGQVLNVAGDGDLELTVVPHTTKEFGQVEQVEIVTYFAGQRKRDPRRTKLDAKTAKLVLLDGLQGYVRLECQTTGASGERFCCFTNPVWVRFTDQVKRRMLASFP